MDCPSCGHPNASGARFCGDCGAPLAGTVRCPSCDAPNAGDQKFCNACGERLAAPGEGPRGAPTVSEEPTLAAPEASGARAQPPAHLAEKIRAGRATLEGERKQVTVLFADVMGSMDLSEGVDAEEWQGIMDRFFAILCEGVHQFEGTVDKFTGDGIMAIFGAPIAHEDHARRAGYAALHLIDRLGAFGAELRRVQGLNFLVRIGLNSGEVVVGGIGEDLGMEYTAVGHTVGLAQRMEQLAEPGSAYVTDDTAALVRGYLALEDLGEFEVKGASRPMRVHELKGIGPARGRLDISQARGFSRFVGREEEMASLDAAFEQSRDGAGQVIGIVGEAGVGKSRLCHEFTQRWRAKGVPIYHTTGQAHTQSVPLTPVIDLLRTYFDITEQDSDQRARERIAGKVLLLDERLVGDLPLIFDFLTVPDPERPPPGMDPEARRRQMLAVAKKLFRAQSTRDPGINLFEDLHWLDPASEAFLANHIDAVQEAPGLTIVNFRPQYQARWMSKSHYGQIALVPLGPEAIAELLEDLMGSDPSLAGLPQMLTERTGGNPFFIEEVTRSLVEAGNLEGEPGAYRLTRPVEEKVVPASVQVVLEARIDRLEQREKSVLHAAAVIGKEFSASVLEHVVELDAAELEAAVHELVAAGFVFEQEIYPETIYAFRHPLTQEVAYGSQLGESRAADHAAVARAIESLYPERLDERSALLAQHWEAAGEGLEAARWNARAAVWTGTRDPSESLRHWHKVRELTDSLPESDETTALGLAARIFGLQYSWRLGVSHEESEKVFEEAERMAAKSGDIHSRALLLSMYGVIRGVTEGDAAGMDELASRSIALAEESEDPSLYMTVVGSSYGKFLVGEPRRAIEILDRGVELAAGDPTIGAGVAVECPYGYCLIFKGGMLTIVGELDEAQAHIDRGIEQCDEAGDIETIGWGHMWAFWRGYYGGETEVAVRHARQALDIAERLGDSFSRTWSRVLSGGAAILEERWEEAEEEINGALSMSEELRTAVESRPWSLAWLSELHSRQGEAERGLELAKEAVEAAEAGGLAYGRLFGALHLARAMLALNDDSLLDEAERTVETALEESFAIENRSLNPALLAELAELARRRGDTDEYERRLAEAHRAFTEIGAHGHAERLAGEIAALAR